MPEINVTIAWDTPDDKDWLNVWNIDIALSQVYKNINFRVSTIEKGILQDSKQGSAIYLDSLLPIEKENEEDFAINELLHKFCGYISGRKNKLSFGGVEECGCSVDLTNAIKEFIKAK